MFFVFFVVFSTEISDRSGLHSSSDHPSDLPKIVLWAWERPEELSFIDRREVGVAFLARTIYLRGSRVSVRPRFQPLNVAEGTVLMAVARIESDRFETPELSAKQRAEVLSAIAELARIPRVGTVQIDFDAKTSERAFYRDLLFDLRRQLPSSMRLSITALASWYIHDNWLSGLPVDEAVPMLFRMGAESRQVLLYIRSGRDFQPEVCRHSLGISTDEPVEWLPSGRRFYIFHPRAWSDQALRDIYKEVEKWQ